MKKVSINKSAVNRTIEALDEVEAAVIGRVRTNVKAGEDGGPGCKPWLCPRPLYGVPLPADF